VSVVLVTVLEGQMEFEFAGQVHHPQKDHGSVAVRLSADVGRDSWQSFRAVEEATCMHAVCTPCKGTRIIAERHRIRGNRIMRIQLAAALAAGFALAIVVVHTGTGPKVQGQQKPTEPAARKPEKEGKGDVPTKAPLTFTDGHDTDPKGKGRPVVLIAAALGVTPEVFREAFRGVTPARDGKPTPEQARSNKAALMKVLAPHGVTNDRLDEVSDYYRYRPGKDQLWRTTPAKGYAVVEQGKIKQIVVNEPGSGYSTPPRVTGEGMEAVPLKVTLHFDQDLKNNGSIASVEVAADEDQKASR
jgi:hypothetical protein